MRFKVRMTTWRDAEFDTNDFDPAWSPAQCLHHMKQGWGEELDGMDIEIRMDNADCEHVWDLELVDDE